MSLLLYINDCHCQFRLNYIHIIDNNFCFHDLGRFQSLVSPIVITFEDLEFVFIDPIELELSIVQMGDHLHIYVIGLQHRHHRQCHCHR